MDNFKQASKEKLRFQTNKGLLSNEQLWDLSVTELDQLAVALEEQHKNSKGKSFLVKTSQKDKTVKLKFDIVLDILNTKVEEADMAKEAMDNKKHNEEIMELIKDKEKDELKGKSVSDLKKMLK